MKLDLEPRALVTGFDEHPKLTVYYFTDPGCSWCWATEPILKRLIEEYADQVRVVVKTRSIAVEEPKKMIRHWSESARVSGMPVDCGIWDKDPPDSTFPACVAYKAVRRLDKLKAEIYLRRLREAFMTQRRDIGKEHVLTELALPLELEMESLMREYRSGARDDFLNDLMEGRGKGIDRVPAMIVANGRGDEVVLSGYKSCAAFEDVFKRLAEGPIFKSPPPPIAQFIAKYSHVTTREVAEVYGMDIDRTAKELKSLAALGEIKRDIASIGEFWMPA